MIMAMSRFLIGVLNKRGLMQGLLENINNLSAYGILANQKSSSGHPQWKYMYPHFTALHKMVGWAETLKNFGVVQLGLKVEEFLKSTDGVHQRAIGVITKTDELRKNYAKFKGLLFRASKNPKTHPKLEILTQILTDFFGNAGTSYEQRVLVFCNNRTVVEEVRRHVHKNCSSRVRVHIFIGHGAAGKSGAGLEIQHILALPNGFRIDFPYIFFLNRFLTKISTFDKKGFFQKKNLFLTKISAFSKREIEIFVIDF